MMLQGHSYKNKHYVMVPVSDSSLKLELKFVL